MEHLADTDPRGLTLLKRNHAGCLVLYGQDPRTPAINYGVIRVERGVLTYWTDIGMREMFGPHSNPMTWQGLRRKTEAQLKELGYIETLALEQIKRVIF